jgi:protein disulfide-isomerase
MRITSLLALVLIPAMAQAGEVKWYSDFTEAKAAAQAENKMMLLDFTGSDWCGWCIKLKKEVFDTPEFAKYAAEKLIMVEVDFPRQKRLPDEVKAANEHLARTYQIEGYPTLIFVDAMGRKRGQGGYVAGGPKAFLTEIAPTMGASAIEAASQITASQPASLTAPAPPAAAPTAPKAPPPNPNAGAVVINYADLQLKGISGSKKHRMALINGQAFEVNDEAKISAGGKEMNVKCVEIGADAVKVVVDGTERELKIGP